MCGPHWRPNGCAYLLLHLTHQPIFPLLLRSQAQAGQVCASSVAPKSLSCNSVQDQLKSPVSLHTVCSLTLKSFWGRTRLYPSSVPLAKYITYLNFVCKYGWRHLLRGALWGLTAVTWREWPAHSRCLKSTGSLPAPFLD